MKLASEIQLHSIIFYKRYYHPFKPGLLRILYHLILDFFFYWQRNI